MGAKFYCHMPLLTVSSTFVLERRC